jgi:hypothetical protein
VAPPPKLPSWPYPLIGQTRRLLLDAGLVELEGRIAAELDRQAVANASVVVVGETSTGKSALINALVGRPDLLPVGPDVTTIAHVIVRYGQPDAMTVYREDEDGQRSQVHPPDLDVAAWASVKENPDNAKHVRAVEVLLDEPTLASGLTLIDTPGVGGLDTANGRVTLAALRDADALVFVADTDRPMIQPELDFLQTATDRIGSVIFVCTKIDVQSGWKQIVEEDRALLAQYAPRYAAAPWLGVSSTLEAMARAWEEAGRPAEQIAELRAEGGVADLRERLLTHVVDRVDYTRRTNVIVLCQKALDVLAGRQHAVTEAGPPLEESLQREEQRLAALETASAQWPQRVSDGFSLLRSRLQVQLTDLVKQYGRHYGDTGLTPYMGKPEALEEALLRETNAVAAELTRDLRQGVAEIEADVLELIEPVGLDVSAADLPDSREIDAIEASLSGGPDRFDEGTKVRNVRLAYSSVAQGMSFAGISHLAFMAALGVSTVSFFGVGMSLGAILAVSEARVHRRQAKLAELRPLVQEALQITQSKLGLQLQEAVLEIQRALETDTRERIKEAHRVATEARQLCQQQMAASAAEQQRASAAADEQLQVVANLQARCRDRLGELSAVLEGDRAL